MTENTLWERFICFLWGVPKHTHSFERDSAYISRARQCAVIVYRCECGATMEEEKEVD